MPSGITHSRTESSAGDNTYINSSGKEIVSDLEAMGFRLQDLYSNNPLTLDTDKVKQDDIFKVLGYEYKPNEDTLYLETVNCEGGCSSKRQFWRCLQCCSDPLGLISPFILYAVVFIR